jgi:hypothetical protein
MQQQQQSLLVQNKSGRLEMKPTRPEKQRQNKGEKKGKTNRKEGAECNKKIETQKR